MKPFLKAVCLLLLLSHLPEPNEALAAPPPQPAGTPRSSPPEPSGEGSRGSLTPSSTYKLSPNDLIHIKVFQEDELETTARIGKDGTVPFPMTGPIVLGGRNLQEATVAIQTALREYLIHPQVALRIIEYTKRKVTVLGQVSRPGTYDLPDDAPLTLLEAIGLAGGYTRLANPSRVTVKRITAGGEEEIHRLDAKRMARGTNAPPFLLRAGDAIHVEESLF